ncbi:MAG TPA: 6-pyruvoyl-tetrahydropterin synthase-related protein [Thermoanaerobaculia bacterium]
MAMLLAQAVAGYRLRQPRGDDMQFHFSSWIEVAHQWRQGVLFPRWSQLANYGFGDPRFVFYPPGSPMLGAALGSLMPWTLVPQAFVCLVLVGAGLSMFRLAREFLPPEESAWAALLYAFNPYALFLAYAGSRMGQLLASVLLPLFVLYVMRIGNRRSEVEILKLAVVFAACWLANAPTGVISTYCMALLVLVLAVGQRSARILARAIASMVLGFLLASFYIVPAAYETRWVRHEVVHTTPLLSPENNFLFTRSPLRKGGSNLVLSLIALGQFVVTAVALAFFALRKQRSPAVQPFFVVLAGACALFMFSVTAFAWKWLPALRYVQFPSRLLAMFNVSCAYLVVAAVPFEGSRRKRAWLLTITAGWALVGAFSLLRTPIRTLLRMEVSKRDVIEEVLSGLQQGGVIHSASGTYLPARCRVDSLPLAMPRALVAKGGPGRADVERWEAERRLIRVETSAPATVVLRLILYPGWRARVNGEAAAIESWGNSCLVSIPVPAGKSELEVTFGRTPDRAVGALLSISGAILALGLLFQRFIRNFFKSRAG